MTLQQNKLYHGFFLITCLRGGKGWGGGGGFLGRIQEEDGERHKDIVRKRKDCGLTKQNHREIDAYLPKQKKKLCFCKLGGRHKLLLLA
jgi:hypothetical protein